MCFQQAKRGPKTSTGSSTRITSGSNWKRSSTTAATSPSGANPNSPPSSASLNARYKSTPLLSSLFLRRVFQRPIYVLVEVAVRRKKKGFDISITFVLLFRSKFGSKIGGPKSGNRSRNEKRCSTKRSWTSPFRWFNSSKSSNSNSNFTSSICISSTLFILRSCPASRWTPNRTSWASWTKI